MKKSTPSFSLRASTISYRQLMSGCLSGSEVSAGLEDRTMGDAQGGRRMSFDQGDKDSYSGYSSNAVDFGKHAFSLYSPMLYTYETGRVRSSSVSHMELCFGEGKFNHEDSVH